MKSSGIPRVPILREFSKKKRENNNNNNNIEKKEEYDKNSKIA